MFLIVSFLWGNIIDIPFGTHRGGIVCGVGVLIIMILMLAISTGSHLLINKFTRNN